MWLPFVLYFVLYSLLKKKKKLKKTRSLRYIDTDFRWADSCGIRYNRFYVIANYVISVVTCIHFKWSSAGPRRGLRNNRELRYIGLRYIDSWLYSADLNVYVQQGQLTVTVRRRLRFRFMPKQFVHVMSSVDLRKSNDETTAQIRPTFSRSELLRSVKVGPLDLSFWSFWLFFCTMV